MKVVLFIGYCLDMVMCESMNMAWWSLIPGMIVEWQGWHVGEEKIRIFSSLMGLG